MEDTPWPLEQEERGPISQSTGRPVDQSVDMVGWARGYANATLAHKPGWQERGRRSGCLWVERERESKATGRLSLFYLFSILSLLALPWFAFAFLRCASLWLLALFFLFLFPPSLSERVYMYVRVCVCRISSLGTTGLAWPEGKGGRGEASEHRKLRRPLPSPFHLFYTILLYYHSSFPTFF